MATAANTKSLLDRTVERAQQRVAADLAGSSQHLITFCQQLVKWVVLGRHKPVGAPTKRVSDAVRAAVTVALTEVYGSEQYFVDDNIIARRNAL